MLDKEDMEAIKYAFNEALQPVKEQLSDINERLDRIEEDIEQLKEDTEITRGATNEVIEWIDVYFREQNKPFPVDRKTPIHFEG